MPKRVFKQLMVLFICCLCLCTAVNASGETDILFEDSFETYGVNGSGKDEAGKLINPVRAEESDGCWFSAKAAGRRETLIFEEENNHYLGIYYQGKSDKNSMATGIGTGQSELGKNKEYVLSANVRLSKNPHNPACAGYGSKFELVLAETAEGSDGIKIAEIDVGNYDAAFYAAGINTEKKISKDKWHNLNVVLSLSDGKAYVSAYLDSEECIFLQKLDVSAQDVENAAKYLRIDIDNSDKKDSRRMEMIDFDNISLTTAEIESFPLIASFMPQNGAFVAEKNAPLTVEFDCEIQPITSDSIKISGGANVQSCEMNEQNTGFTASFSNLKEGNVYEVCFEAGRPGENTEEFSYSFTYTGNKERYIYDWFDSYGVDGSGVDENGKTINPITSTEVYGKWYDTEAASKRGAVIMKDENGVPALNFALQKDPKVIRTHMTSLLKSDSSEIGEVKGVYELNIGFMIPNNSTSAGVNSVGLRGDCFAQVGLNGEGVSESLLYIDYKNGKNRIRFFDSEKEAELSENTEYNVKILLYPESDGYTGDAFIEDDNGLVQILNHEAVNFDNLTSMKRMTVDVNGYDSDKTVILFILKGIDFQCSFTPKLVSCDVDGQIIQMDNNVITAKFDTPVPTETACYSINNGAKIVKADILDEYTVRLTVDGLKNGESYVLKFPGVSYEGEYGCLDTVKFSVEKKIEVLDFNLENGKLNIGENAVNIKLKNTTDEKLSAAAVLLVCVKTDNGYNIEQVVTKYADVTKAGSDILLPFLMESTDSRFIKVFLVDTLTDMNPLYKEVCYN